MRPPSIASSLMRRAVWRAVGGFPEHLRSAEDLLFMNEVKRAGFRIVHAPRALVSWNIQPTLWGTFTRFINYSRHNIRAGLWSSWQAAIFKRYALLAGIPALLAFVFGWKWLLMTFVLWLLMLVARGVTAIRRNRCAFPTSVGRNLVRLLWLVPIIATLDVAAIIGSAYWLLRDRLQLVGSAADVNDDGA
jgi:GT2 family glycosyltransferase